MAAAEGAHLTAAAGCWGTGTRQLQRLPMGVLHLLVIAHTLDPGPLDSTHHKNPPLPHLWLNCLMCALKGAI